MATRSRVSVSVAGIFLVWYVIGLVISIGQHYWRINTWNHDTLAHVLNAILAPIMGLFLLGFRMAILKR